MLVVHGTTQRQADKIEFSGYFAPGTYFLNADLDFKQAVYGTVGFALRTDPSTSKYIDLFCSHDLIMGLFKGSLLKTANKYIKAKKDDDSPGLLYVVDVSESVLDYHKGFLRSVFLPTEVFSTQQIPLSQVKSMISLEQHKESFSKRYDRPFQSLESITEDALYKRAYHTVESRMHRLILGKK